MPRSAALSALVATLLACIWLIADVEIVDAGHLNGLFYTGKNAKLPPAIDSQTYRVQDQYGYDGEFYYLIAHDPLNHRGFLAYVDTPRYRWRRIGLPALAHLLAFGKDAWIDQAYVGLQLLLVFLGAWWLARYAQLLGRSVVWGVAFLVIPAVAVSLDRMTVDLPLAAVCVGLLYYSRNHSGPRWPAYVLLVAAPLIRETGIVLIVAWCLFWLIKKDRSAAIDGALCALPAIGWWAFVVFHTAPDVTSFSGGIPFRGLVTWTVHAISDPMAVYGPRANAVLELVALAGIWLAFGLTVYTVVQRASGAYGRGGGWEMPEIIAIAFTAFASIIGYQDIWASAYGIGRTLSPLLIALAAIALRDRRALFGWPLLLVVPRIALQMAAEIKVALRS